jgi:hypothetical protein
MTVLMTAVNCIPSTNAVRAALSNGAPISTGSCPATAMALPRVSVVASANPAGTSAGIPSTIRLRYTAVPILPITAMPSAPPNSFPVSEIAAAAPARSGGAAVIIRSEVRVNARTHSDGHDDPRGHDDRQCARTSLDDQPDADGCERQAGTDH